MYESSSPSQARLTALSDSFKNGHLFSRQTNACRALASVYMEWSTVPLVVLGVSRVIHRMREQSKICTKYSVKEEESTCQPPHE